MYEIRKNEREFRHRPTDDEGIDLRQIVLALRSGSKTIVVTTLVLFAATLLFCLTAQPYYTGTIDLVVDQRRLQVFGLNQNKQDNSVLSDATIDNNTVDSLVSTISADAVLARVAKKLDLASDPEFNGSDKSLLQRAQAAVMAYLSPGGPPRSEDQRLRAITTLMQKRLKVQRLGTSYVIELTYDATTPTKAATIANAIGDAFLEDQLSSSTETLQRASAWLDDRLKELQTKSAAADLAVLKFRQDNQLELSTRPRELQVQLKNLDSAAQAYRALYDTLLQRYNFAVEQQSLPSAAARVVTRAVAPVEKSFPKTLIFLALSVFLGLCLGAFICIIRSIFDSSVRTRAGLSEVTGVDCVTVIPRTDRLPQTARSTPLFRRRRKPLDVSSAIHPEALERVKLLLSVRVLGGAKVVSFASCSPGEGKTSCSLAFARLAARRGGKVLFIDGDLQNPNATRSILASKNGFQGEERDLPARPRNVDLGGDVFAFLTFHDASDADGGKALPTLPVLANLIAEARNYYDTIVVDLAPLSLSADVSALEPSIDGIFLVAEWGRTSTETLALCLAGSRSIAHKLYGAILNKADVTWLARAERDPTVLMHYSYGRGAPARPVRPRRATPVEPVG